ncbi:Uncharacterised protein [Escherichia coli]|nr:Uncharacterised protein [Escherichia coli]
MNFILAHQLQYMEILILFQYLNQVKLVVQQIHMGRQNYLLSKY